MKGLTPPSLQPTCRGLAAPETGTFFLASPFFHLATQKLGLSPTLDLHSWVSQGPVHQPPTDHGARGQIATEPFYCLTCLLWGKLGSFLDLPRWFESPARALLFDVNEEPVGGHDEDTVIYNSS